METFKTSIAYKECSGHEDTGVDKWANLKVMCSKVTEARAVEAVIKLLLPWAGESGAERSLGWTCGMVDLVLPWEWGGDHQRTD